MHTLPTVCPLDCPDRCSMEATVEGERVLSLRGSRRYPWTEGYICQKVHQYPERVHGPARVLQPMRREGPPGPGARHRPISWEEAIDEIAARWRALLQGPGGGAILPVWYGGSNGLLTGSGLDQRLWHRIGARGLEATLCATNARAGADALYGGMPGADPADIEHAEMVVLWGVNPSASGIHLVPPVRRLQARGGALVVVDPRRTPLAERADLHLPILPGSDVALALALHHIALRDGHAPMAFLEQHARGLPAWRDHVAAWSPARAAAICGVEPALIERFAALYASRAPAFLRCGWGAERNRNASDAYTAMLALPAFYGHFGRRGGGYAISTTPGYKGWLAPREESEAGSVFPGPSVNLSQLGRELEERADPRIEAVYIYNCNPMATVPDQQRLARALSEPGRFVVVHEQVWTDSCDYADIVLPATTFLEHADLTVSYGGYAVQWAEPVIPPVGQARSNHAVAQALAAALGFGAEADFLPGEEELAREMVIGAPRSGPAAWEELRRERVLHLPRPVQFLDIWPADGIRLDGRLPDWEPAPADAELPLVLISPASPQAISSTGFERMGPGEGRLELHPEDAARRGIAEGDPVRAYNSRAEVRVRASLSSALRPGVASLPKGLWRRATLNGWTSNALIPDHVDRAGKGACYNDARIEVERIGA